MCPVLAALMNASQVEARDVSSHPTRRPPGPPAPSPGNRRRPILSRQHTAASRVDKRSTALLTRPAGAEQSLFFDPAAPPLNLLLLLTPVQLYFTAGCVCLTFRGCCTRRKAGTRKTSSVLCRLLGPLRL